jgi:hypothetical protein
MAWVDSTNRQEKNKIISQYLTKGITIYKECSTQ